MDNVFALIFLYFAVPLRYQAGALLERTVYKPISHLAEPSMPPPGSNARGLSCVSLFGNKGAMRPRGSAACITKQTHFLRASPETLEMFTSAVAGSRRLSPVRWRPGDVKGFEDRAAQHLES